MSLQDVFHHVPESCAIFHQQSGAIEPSLADVYQAVLFHSGLILLHSMGLTPKENVLPNELQDGQGSGLD